MGKNKKFVLSENQIIDFIVNFDNPSLLKEEDYSLPTIPTSIKPEEVTNVNQLILYLRSLIKTLSTPEIKKNINIKPQEAQVVATYINQLITSAGGKENLATKMKNFFKKAGTYLGVKEQKTNKNIVKLTNKEFYNLLSEALEEIKNEKI